MKRSYSSHDIEKAVEVAEARGLNNFMKQHPREKRRDTLEKTESTDPRELTGGEKGIETPKKNIFDVIMFGSPQPKTHYTDSFTDELTTSSMSESRESHGLEDDIGTCDPCEEVQEIVRGIKDGKYKLRTTALLGDSGTGRTHYNKRKRLRHPEHWRTVDNPERNYGMNEVQQDQFKYHRAFWDDGNMWALKMSKKSS
ncbi:MAG: CotG/ExsB N-terminal domain-containing protein [Bacillota bacterium]